ncbi:hypothetical protein K469DRAFT_769740 [Zopfia rhizophila CBS 207.26]|uniref:AB hydrolase-1 domain-containing protein n=1 Tax=Zopfia rhizophila CBS 207.26 TaxID=1314779 RepID=A0A6A6EBI9_9PEZI|nr:hypothetical protein K469DRAFT_769740 [Zopfia rhizophila CBS 207.26]
MLCDVRSTNHCPCPRCVAHWECFNILRALLEAEGYDSIALTLPSVGSEKAVQNMDEDVTTISEAVTRLAEDGNDVVIAPHSYGVVPVSEALEHLGKKGRQNMGKVGGVTRIVFLIAWMIPPAASVRRTLSDLSAMGHNEMAINMQVRPPS